MKVVVRVRPTCDQEAGSSVALQLVEQIAVLVFDPKSSHIEVGKRGPHKPKGKCHLFDVYDESSTQEMFEGPTKSGLPHACIHCSVV